MLFFSKNQKAENKQCQIQPEKGCRVLTITFGESQSYMLGDTLEPPNFQFSVIFHLSESKNNTDTSKTALKIFSILNIIELS